ncbi:unnamed protein product [Oikopleura dioica]|uniref:Uncharacterized protein n=1 Tax=Oikopleura dioica TaxID=34765 RepID=E4Z4G1_OIKDI|nr:unnamed protein product [Oikopleura dioica]
MKEFFINLKSSLRDFFGAPNQRVSSTMDFHGYRAPRMSSTTIDGSKSSENQLLCSKSNQSFEKVKFTRSYRSPSMTQEQIEGLNKFRSTRKFLFS